MARNDIDMEAAKMQATFGELTKQFTAKQLRSSVRKGYRRASNAALQIARTALKSSGLHVEGNTRGWERGIRNLVYSKGGGFMSTVKGRNRGNKSMHTNRRGKMKPILMWAEDGTKPRKRKLRGGGVFQWGRPSSRSGNSGSMRAYHFMQQSEAAMYRTVEENLFPEVEKAVYKAAQKAGLIN